MTPKISFCQIFLNDTLNPRFSVKDLRAATNSFSEIGGEDRLFIIIFL